MESFWKRVEKTATCWNWMGNINHHGYGRIRFGGKDIAVHRFSWFIHFGEPRQHVCHKCGNLRCVNPDHLFDGSQIVSKGRLGGIFPVGLLPHNTRLTVRDVLNIQQALTSGKSGVQQLAKKYGVTKSHIYNIGAGRVWKRTTSIVPSDLKHS